MHYPVTCEDREAGASVWVSCPLSMPEIEKQVGRLKAWALIRGATITGPAYVRLTSPLIGTVHLPTDGMVHPHPETGVSLERSAGGHQLVVSDVAFGDIRAAAELALDYAGPGTELLGQVEFHRGPDGFREGSIRVPIKHPLADRLTGPDLQTTGGYLAGKGASL
jgi:hypothetical protein